jgi:hypothetical protein
LLQQPQLHASDGRKANTVDGGTAPAMHDGHIAPALEPRRHQLERRCILLAQFEGLVGGHNAKTRGGIILFPQPHDILG